jgi:hypothetical protein
MKTIRAAEALGQIADPWGATPKALGEAIEPKDAAFAVTCVGSHWEEFDEFRRRRQKTGKLTRLRAIKARRN